MFIVDEDELAQQLQASRESRAKAFADMISNIEKKHSKPSKRKMAIENGDETSKRKRSVKGKNAKIDEPLIKRTTRSSKK